MKVPSLFFLLTGALVLVLVGSAYFFCSQKSADFPGWIELQNRVGQNQDSSRFASIESELEFRLTYGWEDFDAEEFRFSFSLLKSDLKEADEEFGYYPDELTAYVDQSLAPLRIEMIDSLRKVTQRLIQRSQYAEYLSIAEDNPHSFNLRLSAPPHLHGEVKAEFDRITHEIARRQNVYFRKIEKEKLEHKKDFLDKRGLRYIGDKIGVNYGLLTGKNQTRLKRVFQDLVNLAGGKNLHEFLSLMLSFIQEVRYGIPPLTENGKCILGYWVPPKVLIYDFGDCDSKGVTFASLWMNFKNYPLLLIKIPDHLFVGLAVPSFGSGGVTVNGLRYTLCEVTGPDKMPPGIITPYSQFYLEGGNYSYELIK
jgi:hypothetical protein